MNKRFGEATTSDSMSLTAELKQAQKEEGKK